MAIAITGQMAGSTILKKVRHQAGAVDRGGLELGLIHVG